MLYDPKWEIEKQTKADPFSLESLIAWLEKQPADKAYDAGGPEECLLGQFAAFNGVVDDHGKMSCQLSARRDFGRVAFGPTTSRHEWTFGAALERARAVMASAHSTEK